MITPPAVHPGDIIGIVAPARSITEQELTPFIDWAHLNGFAIKTGKYLFQRNHQFAGNEHQRLKDIETMLKDDDVKLIMAARGGYGCGRLLETMNFNLFTDHPKWFAGFSDATVFLSAINRQAGVETLHTFMPFSMFDQENFNRASSESLLRALAGDRLSYRVAVNELNIAGQAQGVLTGGNLSVLYSLSGSPFEPQYEGRILFLEDVDEYLYHIDRMILNLELRGIFKQIAGLIVGSFHQMNDNTVPFGKNAFQIIAERAAKYNVPTLFGFPAGHEKFNHTLIIGREVTLTIRRDYAKLDFSG
ncbi:MAG: LD-carboxypeptidase [Bacteroidales bacterium]|nr:LD-carboxypeptidase [Bacteroidales bacterium]MBN2698772.1 LD-carboxypeptidase [Bacteroidales bacterium]